MKTAALWMQVEAQNGADVRTFSIPHSWAFIGRYFKIYGESFLRPNTGSNEGKEWRIVRILPGAKLI